MKYKIKRSPLIKIRPSEYYETYLLERRFCFVLEAARELSIETGNSLTTATRRSLYRQWREWVDVFKAAAEQNLKSLPKLYVEKCYRCGWIYIYDYRNSTNRHNDCGNSYCYHTDKSGDNKNFLRRVCPMIGRYARDFKSLCSPDVRSLLNMWPESRFDFERWYWRLCDYPGLPMHWRAVTVSYRIIGQTVWHCKLIYFRGRGSGFFEAAAPEIKKIPAR